MIYIFFLLSTTSPCTKFLATPSAHIGLCPRKLIKSFYNKSYLRRSPQTPSKSKAPGHCSTLPPHNYYAAASRALLTNIATTDLFSFYKQNEIFQYIKPVGNVLKLLLLVANYKRFFLIHTANMIYVYRIYY